jgi:hypothetical protein
VFAPGQGQAAGDPAQRVAGWRDDLQTLVDTIPKKHPNPFTIVSREKFAAAAKDLEARLDQLSDWQIYTEFKRLEALIGDAHTSWITA